VERLGDHRRPKTLRLELADLRRIYGRWTTLVDAGLLRFGDALKLTLFAQVGLELCEYPEHVQEAPSLARVL